MSVDLRRRNLLQFGKSSWHSGLAAFALSKCGLDGYDDMICIYKYVYIILDNCLYMSNLRMDIEWMLIHELIQGFSNFSNGTSI